MILSAPKKKHSLPFPPKTGGVVKFENTKSHQRYYSQDGTLLPGVTTVLGVIAKPALIHWAWECGTKGQDYRKVKEQAADIGTIAHFMCECHVTGSKPDLSACSPESVQQAENSFLKFLEFWDAGKFSSLKSEWRLVSETMRFGGTLDCVAIDPEERITLIDFKTSKAIHDEYLCQLSAYEKLWNENMPGLGIQRRIIIRIGKEEKMDLEVRELGNLDKHWNLFQAALALYQAQKALK